MKKVIKYALLIVAVFVINLVSVDAQEFTVDDVGPNSYVIGTHIFTSNTELTMQKIMYASKTITSDNLDDMVMYYKDPWGDWYDAITGKKFENSPTFENIKYEDLSEEYLKIDFIVDNEIIKTKNVKKNTLILGVEDIIKKGYGFAGWNYNDAIINLNSYFAKSDMEITAKLDKIIMPELKQENSNYVLDEYGIKHRNFDINISKQNPYIKEYRVYRSNTDNFADSELICTVSDGEDFECSSSSIAFYDESYYWLVGIDKNNFEYGTTNSNKYISKAIYFPTSNHNATTDTFTLGALPLEGERKQVYEYYRYNPDNILELVDTKTSDDIFDGKIIFNDKPGNKIGNYDYFVRISYADDDEIKDKYNILEIDSLDSVKQYYKVRFFRKDGRLVSTEKVYSNGARVSTPAEELMLYGGYNFLGFKEEELYIYEDKDIYGIYEIKPPVFNTHLLFDTTSVYYELEFFEEYNVDDGSWSNYPGEIVGWEMYELVNTGWNKISESSNIDESFKLDMKLNEVRTVKGRVYKIVDGEKEYSPFSEPVEFAISYPINYYNVPEGLENPGYYRVDDCNELTLKKPTKEGYIFLGWTGSNGDTPELEVKFIPQNQKGTLNYTANWILYGDVNGDNIVNAEDFLKIDKYLSGELALSKTERLAADVNNDNSVDAYDSRLIELYLEGKIEKLPYALVQYHIYYTLDGGTATNQVTYSILSEDIILSPPTKEGYTFVGWTGSNGDIPELEVTIPSGTTGDLNYTANWELNSN